MWVVVGLFLVLGTAWLVNHLYSGDWAASDPRGFEGQSRMARSAAQDGSGEPEPAGTPAPPFADFKRTEAK